MILRVIELSIKKIVTVAYIILLRTIYPNVIHTLRLDKSTSGSSIMD